MNIELDDQLLKEYAFYQKLYDEDQRVQDAFNALYNLPHIDLAWNKALERKAERDKMNQELLQLYKASVTYNKAT